MKRALQLAAPAAVLLAFFAWPVAHVLAAALQGTDAWTWVSTSPYVRSRLRVAVAQAVLSTLLALALAAPLAWLHHRRSLPANRLLLSMHAAPFVLPVFVVVFGLQATLGAHSLLAGLTGFDLMGAIGPLGAVVVANAYYNYGMAARLLHAALERRPRRLEEAALTLGAPPRHALWRVTVPLLLPALLAIALLVFLFSFASFGVVLYLGQGQVATLETLLYENLGGAFARTDRAALLALLQMVLNGLLLGAYFRLHRRFAWRDDAPVARQPAGVWRVGAPLLAAVALVPVLAVLVDAFHVRGSWSLEAWRALLDPSHPAHLAGFSLAHALLVSLGYALAASLLALALTLLLAYGSRGRWRDGVEALAALPLGTSSLVLGLGLALAYGAGSLMDLRGTYLVVLAAHILVALPFTARVVVPALHGLDPHLDESASLLGAPPLHRVLRLHLPLLRPALAVALGTAAALSLGDFGASLLLSTPDTMGLSVWIARHGGPGSFDPLHRAESVALAAVLLALTAGAYLAFEFLRPRARGVR
jgi:thiamine transport system permease protein